MKYVFSVRCVFRDFKAHTLAGYPGLSVLSMRRGRETESFNMKLEFIAFNIKLFSCCGAVTADELSNVRDRPRSWELRQLQP